MCSFSCHELYENVYGFFGIKYEDVEAYFSPPVMFSNLVVLCGLTGTLQFYKSETTDGEAADPIIDASAAGAHEFALQAAGFAYPLHEVGFDFAFSHFPISPKRISLTPQ
jgi:hypothetical protein